MRPFASPAKTAMLLFAGLATLVWICNCFVINSGSTLSSHFSANQTDFAIHGNSISALIRRDQRMNRSWYQLLAKSGYQPGPVNQTVEITLPLLPKHHRTLKWVDSKSSLVLPAIAVPAKARPVLIGLGSAWKGLAESHGLLVTGERWGYSNSRLWVKLAGVYSNPISGAGFFMPFPRVTREITIIQPFNSPVDGKLRITGLLPFPKPRIPPKSNAVVESIPVESTPQKAPESIRGKNTPTTGPPRVALIIDDVGYQKEAADELLKIPAHLTWAILPFTPYSEVYRKAARDHGFEIILHLPLEPEGRQWNPGPGAIMRDWATDRIRDQFDTDLKAVPGVVGINNHMGSAGTRDQRLMGILMEEMKQRKLFFVDSMTDARSVAEKYAEKDQVPFAKRRVFIDNEPDPESQTAALRKLIKLALKEGAAIGIAHARPGIARTIAGMLPEFQKAGVEIVPVSELVQ